ncbi:MAG: S-layer homology domain-containing protein [bacterium]|jgi:hypothetical protein
MATRKFRTKVASFLTILFVLTLVTMPLIVERVQAEETEYTVADAVAKIVSYYENETNMDIEDWELLLALEEAGVDIEQWDLPAWEELLACRLLELVGIQPDADHDSNIGYLVNQQGENGGFACPYIIQDIFAIFLLDKQGAEYNIEQAIEYLLQHQDEQGKVEDVDTTGMFIKVLSLHQDKIIGEVEVKESLLKAVQYLHNAQCDATGGYINGDGDAYNANSTAYALLGLLAAQDFVTEEDAENNEAVITAAIDALFALQLSDGSFAFTKDGPSSAVATKQAFWAAAVLNNEGFGDYILPVGGGSGEPQDPEETEISVWIRVEGIADTGTILEETEVLVPVGSRLFTALAVALDAAEIENTVANVAPDGWLSIDDISVDTDTDISGLWWMYTVNDDINTGPNPVLADGDRVAVYLSGMFTAYGKLEVGSEGIKVGDTVVVTVMKSDGGWPASYIPASGVTVYFGEQSIITDAEGIAEFIAAEEGTYEVYAEQYAGGIPVIVKTAKKLITVNRASSGGDGGGSSGPDTISVTVKIIGKHSTHFSGKITLPEERADVLEALKQTGIPYKARFNEEYVYEIAGEAEDLFSTAGWKYKVNGYIPDGPAKYYQLDDGDVVIWFWADDYTATNPGQGAGANITPAKEPVDIGLTAEEYQKAINNAREQVTGLAAGQAGETVILPLEIALVKAVVYGLDNPLTAEKAQHLQELFQENSVKLVQMVAPATDNLIADGIREVTLYLVAGAVAADTEITVTEIEPADIPAPTTHILISPVYQLGPAGTEFNPPAILSIRLLLPEGTQYEDLVVAWLDENSNQWYPLPTVVDVEWGIISAQVDHFTKFAVWQRESAPQEFADVDTEQYAWVKPQINYLATKGIIRGVGDGTFEPAREVKRAEFVTMLAKALALEPVPGVSSFADVPAYAWYAPYIEAAIEAGIITGIDENTFAPLHTITREQMAVMLANSAPHTKSSAQSSFKDNDNISPWARDAVNYAVAKGMLKGFPDGSFQPRSPVTRAQSAAVIYNLLLN